MSPSAPPTATNWVNVLLNSAYDDDAPRAREALQAGTAVDARASNGKSALWLAAVNGSPDVCRLLLAHGADPNAADNDNVSVLEAALMHGDANLMVIADLVRAGADVNAAPGATQKTPLMHAAAENAVRTARLLLEAGADPNAVDAHHRTALHIALQRTPSADRRDIATVLLDGGVDPERRLPSGLPADHLSEHEATKGLVRAARERSALQQAAASGTALPAQRRTM